MFGRGGRLPVLAEISDPGDRGARPGALGRSQLEALREALDAVADCRAVLATGDEGKSTLAVGLATVVAAEGRRAILVECDLAVPTLAGRLGLDVVPGLHEYLRGEAEAARILQPLVLAGPASGRAVAPLVCVTAGTASADGPDLLGSDRFADAIERLRDAYELVVIDGPPLDAEYSLAKVAQLADATLVCADRVLPAKRVPIAVRGLVVRR
jgi:Mrp family chromosome partitioning ATPase